MTADLYTKNLYKVLGVAPDASQSEIKKAFRRKVKKLHPDTGDNPDPKAFQVLREAYDILSDPERRLDYDRIAANRRQKGYSRAIRRRLRSLAVFDLSTILVGTDNFDAFFSEGWDVIMPAHLDQRLNRYRMHEKETVRRRIRKVDHLFTEMKTQGEDPREKWVHLRYTTHGRVHHPRFRISDKMKMDPAESLDLSRWDHGVIAAALWWHLEAGRPTVYVISPHREIQAEARFLGLETHSPPYILG